MAEARTLPKRGHPGDWTPERIALLGKGEIEQLRENAERLGEAELAVLCTTVLKELPALRRRRSSAQSPQRARHLISRGKAFEARGAYLADPRGSWSAVRKSDGRVVMAMWAAAVESSEGGCACLLWSPNVQGSRPWSDGIAGTERLQHCKLAVSAGGAEGLLVFGEGLEGVLPEDKARSVHGVDPETVLHISVEKRGDAYWATWGGRKAA